MLPSPPVPEDWAASPPRGAAGWTGSLILDHFLKDIPDLPSCQILRSLAPLLEVWKVKKEHGCLRRVHLKLHVPEYRKETVEAAIFVQLIPDRSELLRKSD